MVRLGILPLVLLTLAPPAGLSAASGNRDFSGSYTLVASRGAFKSRGGAWLLEIVQTDKAIEMSKTIDGRKYTSKLPLNGSEGVYFTSSGQQGTGKAQFHGKTLVVDGFVTHMESNAKGMDIHVREKWELSGDSKTLSNSVRVDFPKSPLEGYEEVAPWTEIYARN